MKRQRQRSADLGIVRAEMDRRHELEPRGRSGKVAIGHQHRVLAVWHQDAFLEQGPRHGIAPHRQAEVQPEILEQGLAGIARAGSQDALLQRDRWPVAHAKALG